MLEKSELDVRGIHVQAYMDPVWEYNLILMFKTSQVNPFLSISSSSNLQNLSLNLVLILTFKLNLSSHTEKREPPHCPSFDGFRSYLWGHLVIRKRTGTHTHTHTHTEACTHWHTVATQAGPLKYWWRLSPCLNEKSSSDKCFIPPDASPTHF